MSKGGLGELGMDGASLRNSLTSYFFLSNSVGGKYEELKSLGFRIDSVVKFGQWVVLEGWGHLLLERIELFALAVNAGRLAACVDQHVLSSFPLLVIFNPLSWEET